MKTKIYLLVFTIVMVTFTECKKYDEGPAVSLRSKRSRVAGEWDVASYTVNGESILNYNFTGSFTCSSGNTIFYTNNTQYTRFVFDFTKDGDWSYSANYADKTLDFNISYSACSAYYNYTDGVDTDNGTWKFISDKEKIEMTYNSGGTPSVYEVKELKEKEMKLEQFDAGDVIKITLKKR